MSDKIDLWKLNLNGGPVSCQMPQAFGLEIKQKKVETQVTQYFDQKSDILLPEMLLVQYSNKAFTHPLYQIEKHSYQSEISS